MLPRLSNPSRALGLALTLVAGLAAAALLGACSPARDGAEGSGAGIAEADRSRLFSLLPSSATGVRFENRLSDAPDFNVFTYRNYYNGGGVAIGDLTGDGLPEIVLTANQGGARIYLNRGGFRFREVTAAAGIESPEGAWTTGVTLADVNADGRLDIYLCRAGAGPPALRANELWINQGLDADSTPTFEEQAARYGVADQGFSTQAAFLDHDGDGDLDLFVINNSSRPASSFGLKNTRAVRDASGGAKLFRNDGARFTDVSAAAGIYSPEMAFALGVVVSDVNNDGRPDIYVANDFFERDYLYLNKGDGTFAETLEQQMPVVSYFSMGLDVADVDNDGWSDVYTTDMLPEDEYRIKTTSQFEGWDVYRAKVENGYHHQLMRNMLQRNNRDGTFSDVGQIAGVARTDWSWSALIADMDLDGLKDIFVTNGIAKDITSQDYVAFLASDETMKSVTDGGRTKADFRPLTKAMTSTPLANFAFRNTGGMRFSNDARAWGLETPSLSNGAAYGDLDGDGALDLVVNNVNQESFVYRNNARTLHPERHFLRVRLEGNGGNRFGLGARVTVHAGDAAFMQEQSPTRGFQSSVDYTLAFGLGRVATVDSLVVRWPDGRVGVQRALAADRVVTVRHADSQARPAIQPVAPPSTLFRDASAEAALDYVHKENAFVDFERERLMPKLLSTEGPALAVADVNQDGLDDLYLGGAKEQGGRLMLQQSDGRFVATSEAVFDEDAVSEDVGAVFLDANGDGRMDLYVVSGGSEYSEGAPALQDRLYLNDGRGRFRKAVGALPDETSSGSRPVAADFDGDGDADLFVGGRVVPWQYGLDPRSMLLRNDGRGRFADVTAQWAPALERIGMVTDALARDLDADGRVDLLVVGEWMPIAVFRNTGGGRLTRLAVPGLEKSAGWWNRVVAGDFTGDGRIDFLVGNLGLNGRLRASATEPTSMYVKDFDGNGSVEQILATYNGGVEYPLALRDDLIKALPHIKDRHVKYESYARQRMSDLLTAQERSGATVRQVQTFATTLVRNDGGGRYTMVPLPQEAQLAPVYGIQPTDANGDGRTDILLGGNFDGLKPELGRMSSGFGLLLIGDGAGSFTPMHGSESGVRISGQIRDIRAVRTARGEALVVARNDDRPVILRAARATGVARAR